MIHRRDFLQGSAALFGLAMLPFRASRTQEEKKAKVRAYRLTEEQACFFGVTESDSKLIGRGVRIEVQPEVAEHPQGRFWMSYRRPVGGYSEFGHRSETIVRIDQLSGTVDAMDGFLGVLGNLGHDEDVIFSNAFWLKEELKLAFAFRRPVLVSVAKPWYTPKTRIDAYGHNGGEDIVVPDTARMITVQDVVLVSCDVPRSVRDVAQLQEEWFHKRRMKPSGFDYDRIEREYIERRKKMTPEQIKVEEERLAAYADQNKDLSAWERAAGQLVGFDPKAVHAVDRAPGYPDLGPYGHSPNL